MIGVVFSNTLRHNWREMLYWGLGLAALGAFVVIAIPADAISGYANLLATFPPALLNLIGVQDAKVLATPDGFINFGYFTFMPYILAVYAISAGMNVTANEEDEGILDVVLSWPLARQQILLGRFLAWALMVIVSIVIGYLGLLIGRPFGSLTFDASVTLLGSLNLIPITLLMLGLTVLVASFVRRRSTAITIAGGVVVLSYFLEYLGESFTNDLVKAVSRLSFLTYYDNVGVLGHGLNLGNIGLLLLVTAALVAGSLWAFQRRDINV